MTTTDPTADIPTRPRSVNQAYQESASTPSSKIKVGIVETLKAEGYISNLELTEVEGQAGKVSRVTLEYGDSREHFIAGFRRISKSSLCAYTRTSVLPKVLGGLGIAIIFIFQGLLTDEQANTRSAGGEVFAHVW